MCDLLAHRGPDADGVFVKGPVGLGHRRLAVIDLSPLGHQPMSTDDGEVTITFNGEIYNFRELRAELESRGHRFRSRSDTEVLLLAYREFGTKCLDRLRGMFAFAIYDHSRRTLFLARDRLGKKPLFYRWDDHGMAFASEPQAFFAESSFVATPDLTALGSYLNLQYVPHPQSAFKGVCKLPPAHYMTVNAESTRVERYWKLSYVPKRVISEAEASTELLDRLTDAVRVRLVSDVPLGAFLSGGIDSTTVVALMAQSSDAPVKTYTIGFEDKDHDELRYARLVADRYATDHHEIIVRPDAVNLFPRLVWHYGEPFADEAAIPSFYLAEFTRRSVTVALNGDAGDESFAGYTRYVSEAEVERLQHLLPASLRRSAATLAGALGGHATARTWRGRACERLHALAEVPEHRYARRMMHFTPELVNELCTVDFVRRSGSSGMAHLLAAFSASDANEWVDRLLDVDVNTYLPDCLLAKVDIATMAYGLEGRSPLLDHELMEFVARLPVEMKMKRGEGKRLLKMAVGDIVPREIRARPKKGFSVPLDRWFREDLRAFATDVLLGPPATTRGYFRADAVRRLLHEHATGQRSWRRQIWNLVMLELWHQTFIDQRITASPKREWTERLVTAHSVPVG